MSNIIKAQTILGDSEMVAFFEEVAPEAVEQIADMVSHYNWYADSEAPNDDMDEGDYMDASDDMKEIEWALSEIADAIAMAKEAFRRYGPIYFGAEYGAKIRTEAGKIL